MPTQAPGLLAKARGWLRRRRRPGRPVAPTVTPTAKAVSAWIESMRLADDRDERARTDLRNAALILHDVRARLRDCTCGYAETVDEVMRERGVVIHWAVLDATHDPRCDRDLCHPDCPIRRQRRENS